MLAIHNTKAAHYKFQIRNKNPGLHLEVAMDIQNWFPKRENKTEIIKGKR